MILSLYSTFSTLMWPITKCKQIILHLQVFDQVICASMLMPSPLKKKRHCTCLWVTKSSRLYLFSYIYVNKCLEGHLLYFLFTFLKCSKIKRMWACPVVVPIAISFRGVLLVMQFLSLSTAVSSSHRCFSRNGEWTKLTSYCDLGIIQPVSWVELKV